MKQIVALVLVIAVGQLVSANETNLLKRFEKDLRENVLPASHSTDINKLVKNGQLYYKLTDSEVRATLQRIIQDGSRKSPDITSFSMSRAIKAIGDYGDDSTQNLLLTIADSERLRPIRSVALCSYLKMQSDEDFAAKVKEVISENPKYDKSLRYAVINWLSTSCYDQAVEKRKKDIIQSFHCVILEEKDITNFTGLDEFLREKDAEYAKSEERSKLLKSHSRKIETKNASDIYVEEEIKWFGKERPKKETAIPNISIQI
jgi:hypothetical protein